MLKAKYIRVLDNVNGSIQEKLGSDSYITFFDKRKNRVNQKIECTEIVKTRFKNYPSVCGFNMYDKQDNIITTVRFW